MGGGGLKRLLLLKNINKQKGTCYGSRKHTCNSFHGLGKILICYQRMGMYLHSVNIFVAFCEHICCIFFLRTSRDEHRTTNDTSGSVLSNISSHISNQT